MKVAAYLIAIYVCVSFSKLSSAQSGCFDEYTALFKDRGANKVTDGMQKCVVAIKSKKTNLSTCYNGKIMVQHGMVVQPLMVEKEDGTYEEITAKFDWLFYQNGGGTMSFLVTDGMSPVYHTESGNKARLFFVEFLKPEAVKFKHAAEPTSY